MHKVKISQSLIKDWHEYRISCGFPEKENKMCGLKLKAKYIDGLNFPSSDAQNLGSYFEGFILKSTVHGTKVQSKEKKDGKPTAEYKRAEERAEETTKLLNHYGFLTGAKFQVPLEWDRFSTSGLDIETVYQNTPTIVDTKYSGLLDDKWNAYGWKLSHLEDKDKIITQPVHYIWLYNKIHGVIPRFFFVVVSNKPEADYKVIEIIVDEERLERHEREIKIIAEQLDMEIAMNEWTPFPEVKECAKCPLKDSCKHKIDFPKIDTVYISD